MTTPCPETIQALEARIRALEAENARLVEAADGRDTPTGREGNMPEQHYHCLFNGVNDAVFVHPFRAEGFANFVEVNQAACDRYGYTREEFLRLSPEAISATAKGDKRGFPERRQALLKTGHLRFEAVHITKDGQLFPVEINTTLLECQGRQYILSVVRDISKHKHIESELDESQRILFSTLEALEGLLVVIDRDRRIILCNWKDHQWVPENQRRQRPFCYEVMKHLGVPCEYCPPMDTFRDGKSRVYEDRNPLDGSFKEITVTPIFDHTGEVEYVIENVRDITTRKQAEELLRLSEEKFSSSFHFSNDAILLFDPDGNIQDMNQKALNQFAYPRQTLLTLNLADLHPPEAQQTMTRALQKVREKGFVRFEIEFFNKHHKRFPAEVSASKFEVSHGPIIQAIIRDISETRQLKEALEKRIIALTRPVDEADGIEFEDLFDLNEIQTLQDLFAKATGVASIITQPDGTPLTTPSGFCRLCETIIRQTPKGRKNCYYSDSVIGRHHPDGPIIQPCLSGGLWCAGASITVGGKHIASWLIGQVRDESQQEDTIAAYVRQIGADVVAAREAFREVPVMSREQFGHIADALFVTAHQLSTTAYQNVQQARFITERKTTQQALQKSEAQNRALLNALPDLMFHLKRDGTVLTYKGQQEQLYASPDEFVGRCVQDYLPEDVGRRALYFIQRTLATGQVQHYEYQLLLTNQLHHFEARLVASGADTVLALIRDITEQRNAEHALHESRERYRRLNAELEQRVRERTNQLEAANKELKEFAYVVSHDLKAPLRAISRLAYWLVQDYGGAFDKQGQEMVELLIGRVKRLDKLIEGILHYSRVGRINGETGEIALQSLVAEVIETLSPPAHIRITIDDELPVISGVRIRVEQVFQNLIENAIKFMETSPGTIRIGCQDQGTVWQFSVHDTGPGIEARHYERIFQMFQTLHSRDQHESTGIGLALVKKIVEFYGGHIWVESTVGQGSTFYFTLPKKWEYGK